ncbi:MAG: enoyl-CoA hydratase/isomerase family protein [Alphaproteobacteria bacterium]|nr:enoyl-CoA hydratase/isomerase family protein [Alphaproteobacteria bacterium]
MAEWRSPPPYTQTGCRDVDPEDFAISVLYANMGFNFSANKRHEWNTAMSWNTVEVERNGETAIVRMARPKNLNAFNAELLRELTDVARTFYHDHETHAVILTGSTRAFSAGADLKEVRTETEFAAQRDRSQLGRHLCRAWEEMPQTTIAAIEGFAVGGGVAVAISCDWRVIAEDAFLYVPEVKIGLTLQWQAIPRLVALVGPARAKRIVMLCEKMPAAQALEWGLVEEVAPKGGAVDKAMELAHAVCEMPHVIVTMSKQAINATANANLHAASFMDSDVSLLVGASEAARAARQRFQKS